jgi:hypothetical protein
MTKPSGTETDRKAIDAGLAARVEESPADPRPPIPQEEVFTQLKARAEGSQDRPGQPISMEELGRRIAARRAELGITDADIPRNSGARRTESKKALLKAIKDLGGNW